MAFASRPRSSQHRRTPLVNVACNFEFSPRQLEALGHLQTIEGLERLAAGTLDQMRHNGVFEVLYGGAKGGGKSAMGVRWVYLEALILAARYNIKASKTPLLIGWMGRKRAVDFGDTTLEEWFRAIPPESWRINRADREIVIADRVKIGYGGLDDPGAVEKFNSAQFGIVFLDQAEECSVNDMSCLRATLDRLNINGQVVPGRMLLTANPPVGSGAPGTWLRSEFVSAADPSRAYVRSLWSDNPWLPPTYGARLEAAFRHRPEVLAAYRDGDWSAYEGSNQIIRERWVRDALKRIVIATPHKLLACDPGRFGDDEAVIYESAGTDIVASDIFSHADPAKTGQKLAVWSRKCGNCLVAVDGCGPEGGRIIGSLTELGFAVLEINSAAPSSDPQRYYNTRAEIWDRAAIRFRDDLVQLRHTDETLIGQLTAPLYEFRNGKLLVEGKDELRKAERLGQSPDRADTYIYMLAGLAWLEKAQWARSCPGLVLHGPDPMGEGMPPPATSYAARRAQYEREKQKQEAW